MRGASPRPTGCSTPRSPTVAPTRTWRSAPTRWQCWSRRQADDDGRAMTDRELRDQLMTLLVAGHDTTATGLSWALERLTRHPTILARAVQAADAGGCGGDEYLDAVAKEMLRIRPVVFDVGRILKEPVELAGHRLPAGVMVVPGIGVGARRPAGIPAAGPIRPGPDARRDAEPVDVVAVRRWQSALSGRDVRDGRDARRAARDSAPRRAGHDDAPRGRAHDSSTSSSCRTGARGSVFGPCGRCRQQSTSRRRRVP